MSRKLTAKNIAGAAWFLAALVTVAGIVTNNPGLVIGGFAAAAVTAFIGTIVGLGR